MKPAKEPRKILLVDDETAVLDVTTNMLETLGYKVTATSSSVNALDLFRTDPDQFDLVMTDVTMPNMTGDKLAKMIMEIRSGMRSFSLLDTTSISLMKKHKKWVLENSS